MVFFKGERYPITDRDSRFTKEFRGILHAAGVKVIRTPPRSPNLNAYAEWFVRSIKEECLERMIFFSERQLRIAVSDYVEHYHRERNRQGLDNEIIEPDFSSEGEGEVICRERFGGLLRYYYRDAA